MLIVDLRTTNKKKRYGAGLAQRIAEYQDRCQNMVAPAGTNRKALPKKRDGKGRCTQRPFRDSNGNAPSKCLRKREARLKARRQAQAAVMNQHNPPPEGAYRKPGSMTR